MRKILEEFANGNIDPQKRFFDPNSEYGKLMFRVCEIQEKLDKNFNEEEKKLFNEYVDIQGNIDCIERNDNFLFGFKIGTRMMIEVFNDDREERFGGSRL